MSNHYPHQNRYVPSKLLPTHYYRHHHEFGIPFKRYPLNFDEHEESGYYIDFNQTHLVYAVPCTDITFSKKYNRDDLKNETIDTTAETRETVGTTAARYHNNTHSRHYPHCAHSSHVQGFDVLTIAKLMDYEMQLHDVTPERLAVLFENFACPQRDTVVFEHVWIEQHKFLSMYFKVHKKPLLDYCLFRFPEPPVCPGPTPPTPTDPPYVISVLPTQYYIDPETCALSVDLLVTFNEPVDKNALASSYGEIFRVENPTVWETEYRLQDILGVEKDDDYSATWTVRTTINKQYNYYEDTGNDHLNVTVHTPMVQNVSGTAGANDQYFEIDLHSSLDKFVSVLYEDVVFDDINNQTKIYLAFTKPYPEPAIAETLSLTGTQTAAASRMKMYCYQPATYEERILTPTVINLNVEHNGHTCQELIYPVNVHKAYDPASTDIDQGWEVSYDVQGYLFKTADDYLNIAEGGTIQWSIFAKTIEHVQYLNTSAEPTPGFLDTLAVLMPCDSTDTISSVGYNNCAYTTYENPDWDNAVHATSYSTGAYDSDYNGIWVYFKFPGEFSDSTKYTFQIYGNVIHTTDGMYNSYWTGVHPDEPQPLVGPVLQSTQQAVTSDEYPYQAIMEFDQPVEYVNTNLVTITPETNYHMSNYTDSSNMTLTEFEAYIQSFVTMASPQTLDESFDDSLSANILKEFLLGNQAIPSVVRHYMETDNPENLKSYYLSFFRDYHYTDVFDLNGANGVAQITFVEYLGEIANDNGITFSEITTDPTYITTLNSALWAFNDVATLLANNEHAVDSEFQQLMADIHNGTYTDPMPANDVKLVEQLLTWIADNLTTNVSTLISDPSLAQDLHDAANACVRSFELYAILKDYGQTAEYEQIDNIVNNTLVGGEVQLAAYINPQNFDYYGRLSGQDADTLTAAFNDPDAGIKHWRLDLDVNAVRNPNTGMINNETTVWLDMWNVPTPPVETPVVQSVNVYYNEDRGSLPYYVEITFDQPIQVVDYPTDSLTDGVNTISGGGTGTTGANKLEVDYAVPEPTDWIGDAASLTYTILGDTIAHFNDNNVKVPTQSFTNLVAQDVTPAPSNPVIEVMEGEYNPETGMRTITLQFDRPVEIINSPVAELKDYDDPTHDIDDDREYQPDDYTIVLVWQSGTDWVDTANDVRLHIYPNTIAYKYDNNYTVQETTVTPPAFDIIHTNPSSWGYTGERDDNQTYPYKVEINFDQPIQIVSQQDALNAMTLIGENDTQAPINVSLVGQRLVAEYAKPVPDWLEGEDPTINLTAGIVESPTTGLTNSAETIGPIHFYNQTQEEVQFYDGYDGSRFMTTFVQHGNTVSPEPVPTHSGYDFDGYYTDSTYTTVFDFDQPITGPTQVWYKFIAHVPVPVEPTNQKVKSGGSAAFPIDIHAFGGGNSSHLYLYLLYDTKIENGHSYIKFINNNNTGSRLYCAGNQAFFGYNVNPVKVTVNGTVCINKTVSHQVTDINWTDDYSTSWIDLGAAPSSGTVTVNVYAYSAAVPSQSYPGFTFNQNYTGEIAYLS